MTLGERLRSLRHAHGLTQLEACDRAGISEPTLVMAERDRCTPYRHTLGLIADAYGVEPHALLSGVALTERQRKRYRFLLLHRSEDA